MIDDFSGRTVLITGSSGRLGRVLVRQMLDAGAVVAGVDAAGAPAVQHDRFHAFEADLTEEAQVEEAFAEATRVAGRLSAVIHTVGMWDGRPLAETSLADWRRVMDVNLTSAFLCFREAVRRLEAGGRLVAIASKAGTEGGVAQQAAYSASKAGVVRLVEATARELAGTGVTVAAIAPSMILFGDEEKGTKGVPAERVAALCAYLASDAGGVHNGAVLRAFGTML